MNWERISPLRLIASQILSKNLVKNLAENDINYLSQEFDSKVLYLVKHKEFYPDEYMSDFEKV